MLSIQAIVKMAIGANKVEVEVEFEFIKRGLMGTPSSSDANRKGNSSQ